MQSPNVARWRGEIRLKIMRRLSEAISHEKLRERTRYRLKNANPVATKDEKFRENERHCEISLKEIKKKIFL